MTSMVVAGVMSGTSADGVDVAVCRITAGADGEPRVELLAHRGFGYTRGVRSAVLAAMDARSTSVAELTRLSWRLGQIYGDCVVKTCAEAAVQPELVGCHGQTVYHQGRAARYLGADVRCTSQIGEAAIVAQQAGCPVVSDFRPADMAAGGQGAPLVPMLDFCLFRDAAVGRVLQNLGGISNLTAIPAGASAERVVAFDTGPGNMVVDHCMRQLFGREFDRGGAVARRGRVLGEIIARALRNPFFSALPPKSCGREEFGSTFGDTFVQMCQKAGAADADVVATATALTAQSIAAAYRDFLQEPMGSSNVEYAAAGGGAKNRTLMAMLQEALEPMGVAMRPMGDLGMAVEAKEAVAFALLAWLTWHRRQGNLPAATGASQAVVLGKICFG